MKNHHDPGSELSLARAVSHHKYDRPGKLGYTTGRASNRPAFTLIELMAVVAIVLIMVGGTSVVFLNGRESVKIRSDGNHLISFMRSMLDYTKATGVPLVIQFDPDKRSFSYMDPRTQEVKRAKLESKARVLAIKLNERLYTPETLSGQAQEEDAQNSDNEVFISEGRGLITFSMLLASLDEDEIVTDALLTQLNLISGKGQIFKLNAEEVQRFFDEAEEPPEEVL